MLHYASSNGHTETALALVEAGADVHGKNSLGYGSRASSSCRLVSYIAGRTVRPLGVELKEVLLWRCRSTALHCASQNGITETALALVKAGANVHCMDNNGYGRQAASWCHWFATVLGGRSVHSGRSCKECLFGLCLFGLCMFWLCRLTALHCASKQGRTETAMALVKAGADVHRKDNEGYAVRFSGCILASLGCHSAGRTVRPLGAERQDCLFWLCRQTALHFASQNGHTETAMALVKAGADVHCKAKYGYGFSTLHRLVSGLLQCGADGPSARGGAAEVPVWAVQEHGAAPCVAGGPHGDGDGAGEGGRGRAPQGRLGVRFSRLHPRVVGVPQCGADGPSTRRGGAGVPALAVQGDGAALCVVERPHGDGDGAGQGGRGRASQGQQRVRFSGCLLVMFV